MDRLTCAAVLLALMLAACSGESPPTPPSSPAGETVQETWDAACQAIANQNWAAFYDLQPPSRMAVAAKIFDETKTKPDAAELARAAGLSREELAKLTHREYMIRMSLQLDEEGSARAKARLAARVTARTIDGNTATITAVYQAGTEEEKEVWRFVQEGGLWYVAGFTN